MVLQVSDRGQRRAHRRRHDAARDDAGRHRRRGASRRSQVEAPGRQARHPAAGRPAHPDRGRRVFRSGEGLGRGQDHAGARLQRLRGRPSPQARGDLDLRQVRAAERQGAGEVSRPRPLRGAQAGRGRHGGGGPGRQDRTAHPHRPLWRPRRRAGRAVPDRAMVRRCQEARRGADRGGARRPREVRARARARRLLPLDGEHRALVHLAPAVVGPPDPGMVRPGQEDLRGALRGRGESRGARSTTART